MPTGWRDELKEHCKDVIRKKGLEKVTVEELVTEITPHGRCKPPTLFPACLTPTSLIAMPYSDCARGGQGGAAQEDPPVPASGLSALYGGHPSLFATVLFVLYLPFVSYQVPLCVCGVKGSVVVSH